MRILFCLLALGLASCSSAKGDGPSFGEMASKIAAARGAVREKLRDPSSAEFQNERLGHIAGKEVVCGEVNANNGFGGKSGFKRYISNGELATVTEENMEPEEFAKAWASTGC